MKKAIKLKNNKIVVRELPAPKKVIKGSSSDSNYQTVLLEEMNHNFKAFGEALSFTNTNVAALGETLKDVQKTLSEVKARGDATFEEVGRVKEEMVEINDCVRNLETEVGEIKTMLTKKADAEEVKKLDTRVIRIEKHLHFSVA